jgi:hypothetical protein
MKRWCEHCRGYYDEDHYGDDSGPHRVGREYGRYGELLQAERDVVRLRSLLARLEWAGGDPLRRYCPACSGYQPSSEADGAPGPFGHEPDCWLAAELAVTSHDGLVVG